MSARGIRLALALVGVVALAAIAVYSLPRLETPGIRPIPSEAAAAVPSASSGPDAAGAPDLTTVTGSGYAIGLPAERPYSLVPAVGGDAWFAFGPDGPLGIWVARLDASAGGGPAAFDPTAAAEELAGLLGGMPGGTTASEPVPVELPVGTGERVDVSTGNGRFVAVVLETAAGTWRLLFVNEGDATIDVILRSFAPGAAAS